MAQVGGVHQIYGSVLGLDMATPSRIDFEYSQVPWSQLAFPQGAKPSTRAGAGHQKVEMMCYDVFQCEKK